MQKQPIRWGILCTLIACISLTLPANADTPSQLQSAGKLYTLLAQRIELMQWVALDKWKNHKPIEDKPREAIVLKKAQSQAAAAGILYIDDIVLAQIQIAKNQQTRWMEKWRKTPPAKNASAPTITQLRSQLDTLSGQFMETLREAMPALRDEKLQPRLLKLFNARLKSLPPAERQLLWRALLKLRFEKSGTSQN